MINEYPNNEFKDQSSEIKEKLPMDKLKEYGTKAYAPLVEVVHKYQDEITPYLSAIVKGLQGGATALSDETASEPEKMVASWFREATNGLEEACSKIESGNTNDVMDFVEEQSKKHPSLMFSASYVTGLFFGRIGKHIGKKDSSFNQNDNMNYSTDSLH